VTNVLLIAVPGGAVFTLLVWSLSRLSSDAVALALGLTLGVVSLIPTLWLVTLAARRDAQDDRYDDWQPTIIDYPPPPTIYADQVTPYTHLFRNVAGMPALPDRQTQIAEMRAVLDYIEAHEVQR